MGHKPLLRHHPVVAVGRLVEKKGFDDLLDALALLAAAGVARPRIHVKVDTGLGRNGVGPAELAATVAAVAAAWFQ